MATNNTLPEGTDSIIAGAGVLGEEDESLRSDDAKADASDSQGSADTAPAATDASGAGTSGSLRQQAGDKVLELRGQATDRARDYAEQGKARATEALDSVARMISDTADQVDDKVGAEYGDYARRAGDMVGSLATTLRDKDVDALFADARDLVRRSPAIAATAAAVIGFALVRVVKAGLDAQPQGAGAASSKAA